MSTYVMSDIHGQYEPFCKMMKTIAFTNKDTLYVLGDAIDRGPDGIKILQHIMKMKNVEFILGNHELLLLDALRNLREIQKKDRHDTDDLDLWQDPSNGGVSTYKSFCELSQKEQDCIEQYLKEAWVIRKLQSGKHTFYLSHAYALPRTIHGGVRFEDLTHQEVWSVVWQSVFERKFLDEHKETLLPDPRCIYIGGHTFTQRLDCIDENGRGKIYHNKDYFGYNVYNIDCGMALKNKSSQLSCMRLEDEEKFYVPFL